MCDERATAAGGDGMVFRIYRHETDREAGMRIWREAGWMSTEAHEEAYDLLLKEGSAWVAAWDGAAESLVLTATGTLRYLDNELPMTGVTGVTTSRIARKRGLALRLTARALADRAASGDAVAVLGVFEQGYYNRLGFGNGAYIHSFSLDPSRLILPDGFVPRIPARLSLSDWEAVHASRRHRLHRHGSCSIDTPELTHADMLWSDNGFGLGYFDDDGDLTHHLWCSAKDIEHGPYSVEWMAYRTRSEFLELVALLRGLGDQVLSIRVCEPPGIQLQDLIRQPFAAQQVTEGSPHASRARAAAYWQARILDLDQCIRAASLDCHPLYFNLDLSDPIDGFLETSAPWRGIAGRYVVSLGERSTVKRATNRSLPVLRASVNAFTRLWLGVRPASGIALTDELEGTDELLGQLDRVLRLPDPNPDWDF